MTARCSFLLALTLGFGPRAAAQDAAIFPAGVMAEKVFGGAQFTEGPCAGPDGAIYFSDLTFESRVSREDGHIWRFDPKSGACTIFRSPSGMSNGIKFDRDGRMVVAQGSDFGGRGLIRTDLSSRRSEILITEYNGKPLNSPNDLIIDSKGSIFFTDPRYGDRKSARQPVMGVYRLDPDGAIALVVSDIPMPNGVALSPDGKTLYVGSCPEGSDRRETVPPSSIRAYTVSPEGMLSSGRTIVAFEPDTGPDGLATDRAGHIYAALRDEHRPGIAVYDSTGKQISWIALPDVPSNVAFARFPDDGLLYMTAGGSLYRIRTTQRGFFPFSW